MATAVCSICLETFKQENDVRSAKCGHMFHKKCITDWKLRSSRCPQCRVNIAKLFNVFVSFGTESDERSTENDNLTKEIVVLNGKVMELEKCLKDLQERLSIEQKKVSSQKEQIQTAKDDIKSYRILKNQMEAEHKSALKNIQNKLEDEMQTVEDKCKKREKDLYSKMKSTENSLQNALKNIKSIETNSESLTVTYERKIYQLTKCLNIVKAENCDLEKELKCATKMAQDEMEKHIDELKTMMRQKQDLINKNENMENNTIFTYSLIPIVFFIALGIGMVWSRDG